MSARTPLNAVPYDRNRNREAWRARLIERCVAKVRDSRNRVLDQNRRLRMNRRANGTTETMTDTHNTPQAHRVVHDIVHSEVAAVSPHSFRAMQGQHGCGGLDPGWNDGMDVDPNMPPDEELRFWLELEEEVLAAVQRECSEEDCAEATLHMEEAELMDTVQRWAYDAHDAHDAYDACEMEESTRQTATSTTLSLAIPCPVCNAQMATWNEKMGATVCGCGGFCVPHPPAHIHDWLASCFAKHASMGCGLAIHVTQDKMSNKIIVLCPHCRFYIEH